MGPVSSGGGLSSTGPPPAPPSALQVLPAAQLGSEASGSGEIGRSDSEGGIQSLAGSRRRWFASEGSIPPTGWASPAPSGAGGVAREGDSTSVQTRAVGEGRVFILKGKEERIWRRDSEVGGGGGGEGHVGKSKVGVIQKGLEIVT